jgi:hypothetical protein
MIVCGDGGGGGVWMTTACFSTREFSGPPSLANLTGVIFIVNYY